MRPRLACLVVALAAAAGVVRADDKPDLDRLQGTWSTLAGAGKDIPMRMTLEGTKATVTLRTAGGDDFTLTSTIKLDPKASPKTWDWTDVTGPNGQDLPGSQSIYKLDGEDLVICTGPPSGERPAEFKAGEERFPSLRVFKRAAAAKADDKEPKDDVARLQGRWKAQGGPNKDFTVLMEIKGHDVHSVITPPDGQEIRLKGEFKLDESTKPRQLDWVKFAKPDGSGTYDPNLAIYELDGDTLKVCQGGPGRPRPSEFKAADDGPRLLEFTRQKDGDKPKDGKDK